jgi:hypothetical protein
MCVPVHSAEDTALLEGVGMRVIQGAKGGYPEERRIPKRLRQLIRARDGGICQLCGDSAEQLPTMLPAAS